MLRYHHFGVFYTTVLRFESDRDRPGDSYEMWFATGRKYYRNEPSAYDRSTMSVNKKSRAAKVLPVKLTKSMARKFGRQLASVYAIYWALCTFSRRT